MTRDLAVLIGPDQPWMNTRAFPAVMTLVPGDRSTLQ
jgi:hypothetical protein